MLPRNRRELQPRYPLTVLLKGTPHGTCGNLVEPDPSVFQMRLCAFRRVSTCRRCTQINGQKTISVPITGCGAPNSNMIENERHAVHNVSRTVRKNSNAGIAGHSSVRQSRAVNTGITARCVSIPGMPTSHFLAIAKVIAARSCSRSAPFRGVTASKWWFIVAAVVAQSGTTGSQPMTTLMPSCDCNRLHRGVANRRSSR